MTGNYPGRARTPGELRSDLELAYSLIPGKHRLNLHALYGEFHGPVDRDAIGVEHFQGWIDWGRSQGVGLDFNPSYFSHEKASRRIHAGSRRSGHPPVLDRSRHRLPQNRRCDGRRLKAILASTISGCRTASKTRPQVARILANDLPHRWTRFLPNSSSPDHTLDAVECKLFGIGSESYVVGSHEFYMGYAISRNKVLCLDAGHFHPTEVISDKISSVLMYVPELLAARQPRRALGQRSCRDVHR